MARWAWLLLGVLASGARADTRPLVRLFGTDFVGGGAALFGSSYHGASRVNYVYAEPTGPRSTMTAQFLLEQVPAAPLFLHLRGRLDDRNTDCPVRVSLNGVVLLEGPDRFAHEWEWKRLPIPQGLLRTGDNEITIANISPAGQVGLSPWFMLALCAVGAEDCTGALGPGLEDDFRVDLPREKRPLPEPLPVGAAPGFRLRGMKGWLWRPEQYLAEIPVLARYKLNFLMNCYGSMCDIEHYPWGHPQCNRWWEPLPPEKRLAYEAVVQSCREHAIRFCFSLNPNLGSTRIVRYDSAEDLDLLWQHYAWMQSLGVQWFNVQFDDISAGIDAVGQARCVNALFARLRARNPHAQMVVCPTYYWGTGQEPAAREYLVAFGRELHPDVYVFWTGDAVVTPAITREAAASYRETVGHRLIVWDNYPVNDGAPTLHLGPVTGRDQDLCAVCDGYLANPMHRENEIGRLSLLTAADYAYNPWAYEPERAIGQAILHLAETPEQRQTLADLVELYPGMLIFRQGTAFNPLTARFEDLLARPHSRVIAAAYLRHAEDVLRRLETQFAGRYGDARDALTRDVDRLRKAYTATYGEGR